MPRFYAGLDVADLTTAICVVDQSGAKILESVSETTPEAIATVLKPYQRSLKLVGQEAGTRAAWLHRGLTHAKLPMCCIETRKAHAVLSTRLNKTDANDAYGLALLIANNLFTRAHIKTDEAIHVRAVLGLRNNLLEGIGALENAIRATRKTMRIQDPKIRGRRRRHTDGEDASEASLASVKAAITALEIERNKLDTIAKDLARTHPICQRLITVPGVGPITALYFVATIDDPLRFESSRDVAAYLGLTPIVRQSGQSSWSGSISRRGDTASRNALYMAARSLLLTSKSNCRLRHWGLRIAQAKGYKVAYIAVARKLAVLLHHLWVTGEKFDAAR